MKNRILLEGLAHDQNTFLTVTYSDDHLPADGCLRLEDIQKYWKRLRHKVNPSNFRYFCVGEYGSISGRPHFHAALFGLDCKYIEQFASVWGLGFVSALELNKDTASYIAGYTLKKLTRKGDKRLNGKTPEFFTGSNRKGGIGLSGLKRIAKTLETSPHYEKEVIREINYGGYKMPLGRYLTDKLAELTGNEEQLSNDKEEYIEELISTAMEKEGVYKSNIVETDAQRRKQQKKRHQIWNSRKVRSI